MKLSCTSDEIESFEAMDDAELAKLVRDSLKKFRGRDTDPEAEDDLEQADPSTPSHGGRSESTLETGTSRRANTAAQDSAAALRTLGLSEGRIREMTTPSTVSDADRRAAANLIKGYDRL